MISVLTVSCRQASSPCKRSLCAVSGVCPYPSTSYSLLRHKATKYANGNQRSGGSPKPSGDYPAAGRRRSFCCLRRGSFIAGHNTVHAYFQVNLRQRSERVCQSLATPLLTPISSFGLRVCTAYIIGLWCALFKLGILDSLLMLLLRSALLLENLCVQPVLYLS